MPEEEVWSQQGYAVRFGWGAAAAERMADPDGVLVVVDVLSFTTAVDVAVARGIEVYPCEWDGPRAAEVARSFDAEVAVGRSETTPQRPWSLSPASLLAARTPQRLVLPSPNGSAIAAAAGSTVIAGCLRNAAAVAAWLEGETTGRVITVIAAGERWPDDSMRPALEDLLGAAAVLRNFAGLSDVSGWSPDAVAAARSYDATSVVDEVSRCGSAIELIARGYASDVEVAVDIDASSAVPILTGGRFLSHGPPVSS